MPKKTDASSEPGSDAGDTAPAAGLDGAQITDPPSSYARAEAELEDILLAIESADVDVDELTQKVARARALIGWCRSRLASAELQVRELLADPDVV